jgi:hypothetical protein
MYNGVGNINHLLVYLPTHLLTTYLSTPWPHLLTYLPITLDTYVPTNPPTYLPTIYIQPTFFWVDWILSKTWMCGGW